MWASVNFKDHQAVANYFLSGLGQFQGTLHESLQLSRYSSPDIGDQEWSFSFLSRNTTCSTEVEDGQAEWY